MSKYFLSIRVLGECKGEYFCSYLFVICRVSTEYVYKGSRAVMRGGRLLRFELLGNGRGRETLISICRSIVIEDHCHVL